MIEAILLQIPSPIRKVFLVCTANHHDSIVYVEHVLLHGLILLLLDLIQCPYHSIIVALVTEHLLHVHQQVQHRDILAFIQCVGPFTRVPMETGKNVRAHACLIILLEEGIHIEAPECVHHLCPRISRLEDRHIQSCRCQPLLLPTSPAASVSMLMACSLTCSGVTIRIWCSPVWQGRRQASPTHHLTLGLRWLPAWLCSLRMSAEPSFRHLLHCRRSPSLLGCTSHQLHRRVRLPCIHYWNTRGRVLSPAPQPPMVRGSNSSLPHLQQR